MRTATLCLALATACLLCLSAAQAEVYFHEKFDSLDGWVVSNHQADLGKVALSSGETAVDADKQKGLQLTEDAHFYAVSKKLPTPVSNADKKHFVVSFSVKNEQDLRCGGAYLKFMSTLDQQDFYGESPYWLMFGPDVCGSTRKIHTIFNYKGKNVDWKKSPVPLPDRLTHVYTLHVRPDNTYEVYMDGISQEKGSLEEDWAFLPPKTIPDPAEKKPADWVDDATIADPEDRKPADWDKEPATIVDPDATVPEDWDTKEDGEWEAPEIPNPAYKGEWRPKRIANPAYKGRWEAKQIPNPEYTPDATLYQMPAPIQYVGVDVWQVEAGTIFDNIIIGDNVEEVLKLVQDTYGAVAEEEKAKVNAAQAAKDAEEAAKDDAEDDDDAGEL